MFALCTCYVSRYLPCFLTLSLPGFGLGDFKLRCPHYKTYRPGSTAPRRKPLHGARAGTRIEESQRHASESHAGTLNSGSEPSDRHPRATAPNHARALALPVLPAAETTLPHQPVPGALISQPHHIDTRRPSCSSFTSSSTEQQTCTLFRRKSRLRKTVEHTKRCIAG
jgi:hypothetical protein